MSLSGEGCFGSDKSTLHPQIREINCLENKKPAIGPQKTRLLGHNTFCSSVFSCSLPQSLHRAKQMEMQKRFNSLSLSAGKSDEKQLVSFWVGQVLTHSYHQLVAEIKGPHLYFTLAKNVTRTEGPFKAKAKMSGLMK